MYDNVMFAFATAGMAHADTVHTARKNHTVIARRVADKPAWMPTDPGKVSAHASKSTFEIGNRAYTVNLNVQSGALTLEDHWNHQVVHGSLHLFRVAFADGHVALPSNCRVRQVNVSNQEPSGNMTFGAAYGTRAGKNITYRFVDPKSGMGIDVAIFGFNGENYIQTDVGLYSQSGADVSTFATIDGAIPGAQVVGSVSGSPITAGNWFMGCDHPMAVSTSSPMRSLVVRKLPIRPMLGINLNSVIGVAPAHQMRRAFNNYVEATRPREYAPFLHYNSWYDLGYFTKYTADQCVDRINTFGEQLSKKRGVKLSSFLFDDGWDDTSTVWSVAKDRFPHGLTPLIKAAKKYDAAPGMWLSPWGGYGNPRQLRLETGKRLGYEIDNEGYALSGPKYFERFKEVTSQFVREGVNQFKFDGTGSPDKQYPGSQFASDFDAAISLISSLRAINPKLYINLTTGTWPSPFWLHIADSTWRGGEDHSFAGVGPWREKWITYRDGDTYHGVVQKGPLYPITSLMLHGLIFAKFANHLSTDPSHDFKNEVRSYFGNGTQLQEMYITPSLLSTTDWNVLAQAANWSRANSQTLVDNHWIGGDPTELEVYGWGAWSAKKGIVTLRNPSDHPQAYSLNLRSALQLPDWVSGSYTYAPAYADETHPIAKTWHADQSRVIMLKPFEVLNMTFTPAQAANHVYRLKPIKGGHGGKR